MVSWQCPVSPVQCMFSSPTTPSSRQTRLTPTPALVHRPLSRPPRRSWAPVATPARRRWDFELLFASFAALQAAQALVGTGGDTGKETVRFCTNSGRAGAGRRQWRHRLRMRWEFVLMIARFSRLGCPGPPESQWHTGIVCFKSESGWPIVSCFKAICQCVLWSLYQYGTVPVPVHVRYLCIQIFCWIRNFRALN